MRDGVWVVAALVLVSVLSIAPLVTPSILPVTGGAALLGYLAIALVVSSKDVVMARI